MWFCLHSLVLSSAHAEDPEFLLSDLQVRLDLPQARWRMTKWSTSDFEGQQKDDPVFLYAWSTPIRAPSSPPEGWGPLFVEKAVALGGSDASVTSTSTHQAGDHAFSFVDVKLSFQGTPIVLRGASTELDGKNFHFAVVGNAKLAKQAERERENIAAKLEFTAPVPDAGMGGTVSMKGVTTKLPPDWRPLQAGEFEALVPKLGKLGVEDFTSCWLAVRKAADKEPEVMASCRKPMHLGVVDTYSFGGLEGTVRESLFGPSVPPGSPVEMPDRMGFLYVPRDGLAMGVAPDGEDVAVVWALGHSALGDSVKGALQGTTFETPHAVATGDQVSYWLGSRTTSPAVLCPLLCCVGGVGLVVVMAGGMIFLRGRRSSEEDDS
jgi:hypothetical protein